MRAEKISLILNLAKRGALQNFIKAGTNEMASELKVSQQTASRWLLELQDEALVERRFNRILLTKKAGEALQEMQMQLQEALSKASRQLRLHGKVIGGMREGRYYLSIKEYRKQVRKALGYDIYAGTLNLLLSDERSKDAKRRLMATAAIEIEGFRKNGRLLGGAKLFKARISANDGSVEGAAIIPYKSHYGTEILELVSKEFLRRKLRLKKGDEVEVLLDI